MIRSSLFVLFIVCIYLSRYSVQATIFQCNATASCGCSRFSANINAKIVGGEIAASNSWGWAVSLRHSFGTHTCGGTILSPNYVLTAAHCVEDDLFRPSAYTVVVGTDTLTGTQGQTIPLSRIYSHPGYNSGSKENDIAILFLSRPISFSGMNVAKICLPAVPQSEQPHYPIVKKPVVAIGWGSTVTGGSSSNYLRQVTVKTVGNKETKCKSSLRNGDLQFCAAVDRGGKDTCQGDSGGPLMYYSEKERLWVLAGVTSYGRGCALADHAGVYTRVSAYTKWIQSIVGNNGIVTVPQSKANIGSMSNLIVFAAALFLVFISF